MFSRNGSPGDIENLIYLVGLSAGTKQTLVQDTSISWVWVFIIVTWKSWTNAMTFFINMYDYEEEYDCILNDVYRNMDSSFLHNNFILSNLNDCRYFAFVFG